LSVKPDLFALSRDLVRLRRIRVLYAGGRVLAAQKAILRTMKRGKP
jgi:hypothetical protein